MPSAYQPRQRGGGYESPEPGQILPGQGQGQQHPAHASLPRRPTREWEYERDPRVPPTVGNSSVPGPSTLPATRGRARGAGNSRRRSRPRSRSATSSRSSQSRSRSRSRSSPPPSPPPLDFNSKEIRTALDSFARAMHATLLSTSAHSLETQHLKRLQAFPQDLVNHENLLEAQSRTREAESELNTKLRDVHAAFDLLMSRTVTRLPQGAGGRGSAGTGMSDRLERQIRDKVDYTELLAVKKRVGVLEREREQGKGKGKEVDSVPTAPAVAVGPAPAAADTSEAGEKRGRARALLDDMMSRLESVEGMRTALEDRYTDLENLMNWRIQEDLEVQRLGNGRWKLVEALRDPDGVIRGSSVAEASAAKRRRIDSPAPAPEPEPESEPRVVTAAEPAAPSQPTTDDASKAKPTTTDQPASTATATKSDPALALLRLQIESLRQELESVKAGQAEREKKLVEETVASLKGECVKICREQILKTVEALKTDGRRTASPSVGSSTTLPVPGRSPAVSTSPVLPTIPQGSAPPSQQPPPPQQQQQGSSPLIPIATAQNSAPGVAQSPVLPPPRPASNPGQSQQQQQQQQQPQSRSRQSSRDMTMSIEMPQPTLAGWIDGSQSHSQSNSHHHHHYHQPPQSAPPSSAPASNPLNRLMQPHSQPPPVQYPQAMGLGAAPYDTYRPPVQQQGSGTSFVQKMSNVLPQPPAPPQYMQMPMHDGSPTQPLPQAPPGHPYGFQAWSQYGPSAPQ